MFRYTFLPQDGIQSAIRCIHIKSRPQVLCYLHVGLNDSHEDAHAIKKLLAIATNNVDVVPLKKKPVDALCTDPGLNVPFLREKMSIRRLPGWIMNFSQVWCVK
jgi:hypothetical protein